jgi:hypothetical protein
LTYTCIVLKSFTISKVIHYGIAWTQGDNEQRVGRVDRMFGKLDKTLAENESAVLPIYYPYLSKTLDQDQVCRFIIRKHTAERLIDKLKNVNSSKEVNYLERVNEDWEQLFNKPTLDAGIEEPFGVKEMDFTGCTFVKEQEGRSEKITSLLIATLQKNFGSELVMMTEDNNIEGSLIAAIKHIRKNQRHQPVFLELHYYEPGLALINQPVYCLQIKTPISKNEKLFLDLRSFGSLRETYRNKPHLKICLDKEKRRTPFKLYCRCDLPIVLSAGELNISEQELVFMIRDLIAFADDLENKIVNTDLQNEEVITIEPMQFSAGERFLPQNRGAERAAGWRVSPDSQLIFKEKVSEKEGILEGYQFNHEMCFERMVNMGEETIVHVACFKQDALPLEIRLLGEILR